MVNDLSMLCKYTMQYKDANALQILANILVAEYRTSNLRNPSILIENYCLNEMIQNSCLHYLYILQQKYPDILHSIQKH